MRRRIDEFLDLIKGDKQLQGILATIVLFAVLIMVVLFTLIIGDYRG